MFAIDHFPEYFFHCFDISHFPEGLVFILYKREISSETFKGMISVLWPLFLLIAFHKAEYYLILQTFFSFHNEFH